MEQLSNALVASMSINTSGKFMKRSPLRPRSKKRERLYSKRGGRRDFVAHLLQTFPICQASLLCCTKQAVDVHELLARSQGGSILDPDNCITVCRPCHTWIGDNPKQATVLGLRRRRYGNV